MAIIPFHDRDGFIWMDGQMVPWREAQVHYLTHALHYATCVFEGERAYNGRIFKSRQHSERLAFSAKVVHIDMPYSVDEIEAAKQEVMKANNLTNAYFRVAVWRGSEQMGIDVRGTQSHMAVAAWDWGSYFDPAIREKGISLGSSKWRKPAPNTAPTNSKTASLYNVSCIAKVEAIQQGFNDAFMLDHEGFVAESTGANLFAIKDGVVHTPIADRFLNGITRQTVIEICKKIGMPLEERRIKPEEMSSFQEVFLTGSAAELTPVGRIDDINYIVGPITRKLSDAYTELTQGK